MFVDKKSISGFVEALLLLRFGFGRGLSISGMANQSGWSEICGWFYPWIEMIVMMTCLLGELGDVLHLG